MELTKQFLDYQNGGPERGETQMQMAESQK